MNKKNGFTLVELLAVIVIIGVLFSISTIAINSIKKKEDLKNAQNVISGILSAAKRYESDNQYKDVEKSGDDRLKISSLDSYTDYDKNKYVDLKDGYITIENCPGDSIKLKYSITDLDPDKYGNDKYNDCGCEKQGNVMSLGEKLCE